MKRRKIGNILSAVLYFLIALWLIDFDNPDKLFAAFITFLAAIQSWIKDNESDYSQRLARRLSRVILFLTLFLLIKIWLTLTL